VSCSNLLDDNVLIPGDILVNCFIYGQEDYILKATAQMKTAFM